ncbi:unnamed protein product, partial [Ectocarpus sp. 13 AM-2016]
SPAPSPEPSLNNTKAALMMPMRLDALTIAGLTGTPHGGGGGGFAWREMAAPSSPAAGSDATLSSIQDSSCGGGDGGNVGDGDGSASVLSDDLGSVTFTDDSGTTAEREREDSDSGSCDGSGGVVEVAKTGPLLDGEVKGESTAGGGGGGGAMAAEERGQRDRGGRGPATAEAAAGGDSSAPARAARDHPTAVAGATENGSGTSLSPASHRASPSPDSSPPPPSPRKGGQQRGHATTLPAMGTSQRPTGLDASTTTLPAPSQERRRSHQQDPDNSRAEGVLADSCINKSGNSSNNDNQRRFLRGGSGTATAVATAVGGADSGGGGVSPAPPPPPAEPPRGGAVPTVTCKVLVVGNAKCGKSSIISRFVSNRFSSDYNSTVGADYAM